MNSGENNNSDTPSSQIHSLSMEFKVTLARKLDEKLAALEAEKKLRVAEDAALDAELEAKDAKLKEVKMKIKSEKIEIKKLEKDLDGHRLVAKDLCDYTKLLKADLKKSQEKNIAVAEEHKKDLENIENKWKTFQAGYETLPLAKIRNAERIALQKAKIELMVKQARLVEMNKIVKLKKEIRTKRRNNVIVECAELWKSSQNEDIEMRAAIEKRKIILETIRQQEITLAEIAKKEEERASASQQLANETTFLVPLPPYTPSPLSLIHHFDLSTVKNTLTKDLDSISITSSVVDDLLDQVSMRPEENTEYNGQEQEENTNTGLLDSFIITTNEKEGPQSLASAEQQPDPSATLRFEGMDEEEEAFEVFETAVTKHRETESVIIPLQSCPSERKRPKVLKTERVQLRLTPNETTEGQNTSLPRFIDYTAEPSPAEDHDWKADVSSPSFSYSESHRENAELQSSLLSETSVLSDDYMKKFHVSFSPERGENEEQHNLRSIEDNQTPRQTGAQQRAPGFLNMRNADTPTTSRGKRKGNFFLNLF